MTKLRPQSVELIFFCLHTLAVYVCALFFSPRLVSLWFLWIAPRLQISSNLRAADWFLQHILLVSIVPALIVGYLNVRRPNSMATWSWSVPAVVLAYKMLTYHNSGSLLDENQVSLFQYFFGMIQQVPTFDNPFVGDAGRVLVQMNVTAPFCAGLAYSTGALLSKHNVVRSLFTFGSRKNSTED